MTVASTWTRYSRAIEIMMYSVLSPAEKHKAFERYPLGGISLMKAESFFASCESLSQRESDCV